MNTQPILIHSGTVLDPARNFQEPADVLIIDGRVADIAPNLHAKIAGGGSALSTQNSALPLRHLDAKGCFVTPGFVDIHIHLREPGQEAKETIATGSAAAVAGGFTTVCCMPNTTPALDDATQIEFVYTQAARADLCHVLPFGAITKARKGAELAEIGLMHEAGAIGFSDDGVAVGSAAVMAKALQYVKMFNSVLSQHCEETTLAGGAMNSGPTAARLGIAGIPASAEELVIARDILLNSRIHARYHVQHISTAGAIELVRRAKGQGQLVTTEVTPHHLLLTDEACSTYDSNTKMNPPLRTAADIAACIQGLIDGTIDCLATDHAPHTQEEKDLEFDKAPFGIVGLETALALYVKALITPGHLTWLQLIEKMTINPARVMNIPHAGHLAIGSPADIALIDPQATWTVDPDRFRSKGRNTPFTGWQVQGKVIWTLVGGKVVYNSAEATKN